MTEMGSTTAQHSAKRESHSESESVRGLDESSEEEDDIKTTSESNRRQSRATIQTTNIEPGSGARTPQTTGNACFNDKNAFKKVSTLTEALAQIQMIISGGQEKGAKPYQEDSTCIFYSPDLTVIMGAIFDGHGGSNGQIASTQAANLTHDYFEKNWKEIRTWTEEQWRKAMAIWFDELHLRVREGFVEVEKSRRRNSCQNDENLIDDKGVIRRSGGQPIHGGTTATIFTAIRLPTNKWKLVCANVGDSDCLLLARKPARLSNNQICTHLSVDHSPDSSLEYLRIKELPANEYPLKLLFVYDQANVTKKYECPLVFLENGTKDPKYVKNPWGYNLRPTNVRYDPAVYAVSPLGVTNDVTCIAMTRSLGDFYAHQFGLSHHPDVTFYDLDCNDEYLVTIGSDGIWDCWKWEAFADYINGNLTKVQTQTEKVVQMALRHTVARAKSCFGESSFDDTSLIIISLIPDLFPPIEHIYPNGLKLMSAFANEIDVNSNNDNAISNEESKESQQSVNAQSTNTNVDTNSNSNSNSNSNTDISSTDKVGSNSSTLVQTQGDRQSDNSYTEYVKNTNENINVKTDSHLVDHANNPVSRQNLQENNLAADKDIVMSAKNT